jgi:hypothetical protein
MEGDECGTPAHGKKWLRGTRRRWRARSRA